MNRSVLLMITSLLSILFLTFHLSDEVVRGMEPGGFNMLVAVLIILVWLYGTLVLAGRRSGYVIMLLGAIFGTGVPILHMSGVGLVGGKVAPDSAGAFFLGLGQFGDVHGLSLFHHPLRAGTVGFATGPGGKSN